MLSGLNLTEEEEKEFNLLRKKAKEILRLKKEINDEAKILSKKIDKRLNNHIHIRYDFPHAGADEDVTGLQAMWKY